jgi:4-hydroxy-tetrahydrodipicolinate reductase
VKKNTVAILGATGRMGKELVELLEEQKKIWALENDIGAADIVVDFSSPKALEDFLQRKDIAKVPLVTGTTGLTAAIEKKLKLRAKNAPVLWSPNFSLGVATLMQSLSSVVALKDYDFFVQESHHKMKKDSPSGTAKRIHQQLENTLGRKVAEPESQRGGGDPGTHRILMMGPEETLVFEHRALSRKVFARGALQAAAWLVKQRPGFYSMEDFVSGK